MIVEQEAQDTYMFLLAQKRSLECFQQYIARTAYIYCDS